MNSIIKAYLLKKGNKKAAHGAVLCFEFLGASTVDAPFWPASNRYFFDCFFLATAPAGTAVSAGGGRRRDFGGFQNCRIMLMPLLLDVEMKPPVPDVRRIQFLVSPVQTSVPASIPSIAGLPYPRTLGRRRLLHQSCHPEHGEPLRYGYSGSGRKYSEQHSQRLP